MQILQTKALHLSRQPPEQSVVTFNEKSIFQKLKDVRV